MFDHQNGGWHGLTDVTDQLFEVSHQLRLAHDDELVLGHHRKTAGRIDHFRSLRVESVEDQLVEILLRFGQDTVHQELHQLVDEVGFLAHQQIDGLELPHSDVAADLFEGIFFLCHRSFMFLSANLQKRFCPASLAGPLFFSAFNRRQTAPLFGGRPHSCRRPI